MNDYSDNWELPSLPQTKSIHKCYRSCICPYLFYEIFTVYLLISRPFLKVDGIILGKDRLSRL